MSELGILDPFGDYRTRGYLRNLLGEQNLTIVGHLETASFTAEVHGVLRFLRRQPEISYSCLCRVHRQLFSAVYPWAGEDRRENAPHLAITEAGYNNLFAHPQDVQRAAEYALQLALDPKHLRARPGEVFSYLAYAHPFLEGNGRTLLTVFAELCRRASFHIEWEAIEKQAFLQALTADLLQPGDAMNCLLLGYCRPGSLSLQQQAGRLRVKFGR